MGNYDRIHAGHPDFSQGQGYRSLGSFMTNRNSQYKSPYVEFDPTFGQPGPAHKQPRTVGGWQRNQTTGRWTQRRRLAENKSSVAERLARLSSRRLSQSYGPNIARRRRL